MATTSTVDRAGMEEFVRPGHHGVLMTTRANGGPQLSPVTMGLSSDGKVVVSTYPDRAKAANLRRRPTASVCVLSDEFNGAWIQLDGTSEVIDPPDSVEPLVDDYQCIARYQRDLEQ